MDIQGFDVVSRFIGAGAVVVGSMVAAFYAHRQADTAKKQAVIAHEKLALDLFQRRIDAYSIVRRAIGEIARSGASSATTEITLLEAIDAARFLFGRDVRGYLDQLYKHLLDLDYQNKVLNNPNATASETASAAAKRTNHFQSITKFYTDMDDLFGPYLAVGHIQFNKQT